MPWDNEPGFPIAHVPQGCSLSQLRGSVAVVSPGGSGWRWAAGKVRWWTGTRLAVRVAAQRAVRSAGSAGASPLPRCSSNSRATLRVSQMPWIAV